MFVGQSFRFGHRQSGDVAALARLGARTGFSVEAIAPVLEDGTPISSSRVRDALAAGDAVAAARLLGRPYFIDGRVVRGDGRGRTIGVPTANLAPENEILPARGVYAGRCRRADGSSHAAVVNVGERPTFGGETETIEAHLLDFDGDLYGAGSGSRSSTGCAESGASREPRRSSRRSARTSRAPGRCFRAPGGEGYSRVRRPEA